MLGRDFRVIWGAGWGLASWRCFFPKSAWSGAWASKWSLTARRPWLSTGRDDLASARMTARMTFTRFIRVSRYSIAPAPSSKMLSGAISPESCKQGAPRAVLD